MLIDRRQRPVRIIVLRYIVVGVFLFLASSFWYLQVAQHAYYQRAADANLHRTVELTAPRGILFDRDGRILVENRYAFDVALVPEQIDDPAAVLARLADVAGVDAKTLSERFARHEGAPGFRPVVVITDASLAQVASIAVRRLELPGVLIQEIPTRYYPRDDLAAHVLGHVGEISEQQLSADEYDGAVPGDVVGQSGVEQVYNQLLRGHDGARQVVVNSLGRELQTVGETPPSEGTRLQLTIDYDLQRALEDAFAYHGYIGSAVFLDPRSGEVLAITSLPAYDPNRFARGIDQASWAELANNPLRPLQNRAIQGRYSPGSVFKVAMAVAALEEEVIDPEEKVFCNGGGTFHGRYFRCLGQHGWVDMRRAIERSCNTYFYTIGNRLGIDRIHKWATALGLGVESGIDLAHETTGLMPSSEWKQEVVGERWYAGETISVSIGQGQVSVTPISLAVMMATVANGGTRVVPSLLRAVDEGEGWEAPAARRQPEHVPFHPETLEVVREGLWRVVNAEGTGRRARIEGRDVAGKTGTAQVMSIARRRAAADGVEVRDHGWFVFFAPSDEPLIAGVVMAEHSDHGYLAAPIAKYVLETFFAKRDGLPLPTLPAPEPAPLTVDSAPPAETPAVTPGE